MDSNSISCFGIIERGRIKNINNDSYVISSLDRDGIELSGIKTINDTEYSIGDYVYFFSFRDGTGAILSQFTI